MKLEDYLKVIGTSTQKDWLVTQVPTFLYRLVPVRVGENRSLDFQLQEHTFMLSYKKDLAISMAWGLVDDKGYSDAWSQRFPDKRATSICLDFLYYGSLIFRDVLVAVDGFRCILPQPPADQESPPYTIPGQQFMIARLVHRLVGPKTNFEDYFKRAGMKPVQEPWPSA